jgi:hypothetical protein
MKYIGFKLLNIKVKINKIAIILFKY